MLASQAANAAPLSCRKCVTAIFVPPSADQKNEIAPPDTPNACRTPRSSSASANATANVSLILRKPFQQGSRRVQSGAAEGQFPQAPEYGRGGLAVAEVIQQHRQRSDRGVRVGGAGAGDVRCTPVDRLEEPETGLRTQVGTRRPAEAAHHG